MEFLYNTSQPEVMPISCSYALSCLDATKFASLSVFSIIETIGLKAIAQANTKKSPSGWHA